VHVVIFLLQQGGLSLVSLGKIMASAKQRQHVMFHVNFKFRYAIPSTKKQQMSHADDFYMLHI
jgi:hypothetical protein